VAIFSKFFGRTVSEAAGVAAGLAVAAPLRPVVQLVENETWAVHPDRPVNVTEAAAIVAEDVEKDAWGVQQASWTGFDEPTFRAILGEVLNAPGLGELYEMWRRDLISDADFTHGLRKAKIETRWDAGLEGLHDVLLSSEELAAAQQQGFVDESRANAEGALQGVTEERQQIRFEMSGLPPGIVEGLQMLRRGIIDEATFAQIVREGHTKTKYTDDLLQLREVVLNANDYVANAIRGWSGRDAMVAGGALTGHTPEQMDLLFQNHGRPLSWHQVFIGLRRGGIYDGPIGDIDPAFLKGLRESDIRPEWYNLAWAQRYTYPAAFVLRTLVQSGDLTAAEGEQILLYEGWEPGLAKTVSAKWAQGTSAAAKEATAADILARYDGEKITQAEALAELEALGYPAEQAQRKLDVLDARRVVAAKGSAIGDLHTVYKKGGMSNAAVETALASLGVAEWARPLIVAAWETFLTAEGGTPPA